MIIDRQPRIACAPSSFQPNRQIIAGSLPDRRRLPRILRGNQARVDVAAEGEDQEAICRQADATRVISEFPSPREEISCRRIDDLTTKAPTGTNNPSWLSQGSSETRQSLPTIPSAPILSPTRSPTRRVACPRRERDASLPEVL